MGINNHIQQVDRSVGRFKLCVFTMVDDVIDAKELMTFPNQRCSKIGYHFV